MISRANKRSNRWSFGLGFLLAIPLVAQAEPETGVANRNNGWYWGKPNHRNVVGTQREGFRAPANYEGRIDKLMESYSVLQANVVVDRQGSEEELALLRQKQQDFVKLVDDAKKDGITPEEWRLIKRAYTRDRAAQDQIRFNDENLLKRVESQRARINAARAAGQITEAQKAALEKKLAAIETKIKTKGGSVKFLRALDKHLSQNNKRLQALRTDDQGKKLVVADRDKDGIDERQRKLMVQFGGCLGKGNIAETEEEYLRTQIVAIRTKESQYGADGTFTKDEKDDLNQLLAKAENDTKARCEKGVVASPTPAAQAPAGGATGTGGGGVLLAPTQEITPPAGGNSATGL